MPDAVACENADNACTACLPFGPSCDLTSKRDKNSRSKKDNKKSENCEKNEAAGGDNHCRDDTEVKRMDETDASSCCKLDKDNKDKLVTDKAGKEKKKKPTDSKRSKRRDWIGKRKDREKDVKLSAVYSCTEATVDVQESFCEAAAKQTKSGNPGTCKEREKELRRIEKERKKMERLERQRERSRCKSVAKSSTKLGRAFKCKNARNPTLRMIGSSAETNCARFCELMALYLKQAYRFYTFSGCNTQVKTQFEEIFRLLMKTLSCMCRDCSMLVRYIWRILVV